MGCYCDKRKGGAGKENTPYTWHLYFCEYMLVDLENYSYEQFKLMLFTFAILEYTTFFSVNLQLFIK